MSDGTFTVDLAFTAAPPADLLPGQAVQGKFSLGTATTRALAAGRARSSQQSGGDWVFVRRRRRRPRSADGFASGAAMPSSSKSSRGLEPGERVITSDYTGYERRRPHRYSMRNQCSMLKLEQIGKVYRTTEVETQRARDDVSLQIDARRVRRGHGPVGLRQVDAAQHPRAARQRRAAGTYQFFGEDVARLLREAQLTALRRAAIGFVFQSFNLIDDLIGGGERRGGAALSRRAGTRAPQARGRSAGARRHRASRAAPAAAALRRPAAARGRGARAGVGIPS